MADKLLESAQERWRRFNGHELVTDVLADVKFKDGIKVTEDDNHDDDMTDERAEPEPATVADIAPDTSPAPAEKPRTTTTNPIVSRREPQRAAPARSWSCSSGSCFS